MGTDGERQTHLKCRAAECGYRVTVPFTQALREWPRHHGAAMQVDEQASRTTTSDGLGLLDPASREQFLGQVGAALARSVTNE